MAARCEELSPGSVLFRPLFICLEAFKIYNKLLTTNPVLTKSVTSGILGAAGATVASLMVTKVEIDVIWKKELKHHKLMRNLMS